MSEPEIKVATGRSETIMLCNPTEGVTRKIVMKPKSFLSKDFHMEVDEEAASETPGPHSRIKLLIAALIGIPLLLYATA